MEKIYLCYNNQIYEAETTLFSAQNRSFKYGDGLFESMVMFHGQIPFFKFHFERLCKGMKTLEIRQTKDFNATILQESVTKLKKLHASCENARIRLMVFRETGGFYLPKNNEMNWLLEMSPMQNQYFELNENGLRIDIFPNIKKGIDILSPLKTNNALIYIMATLYQQKNALDDCLILNTENHIADATSANVCLVKNGLLVVPHDNDGGVHGIMIAQIMILAYKLNIPIIRKSLTVNDLQEASEIWLTNAVRGIRWVAHFRETVYKHDLATFFVQQLNERYIL
ncbi:MAG: aminotransferase class IV [Chitinophagales bacterium]